MARATTPPAAWSRSVREAGTALPCARATARSGVSSCESGALTTPLVILDMLDYALGKSRGRDLGRGGHQAREIVGGAPRPDRPAPPPHDCVRPLPPFQLLRHPRPRQGDASRGEPVPPRRIPCRAARLP